MAFAIILSFSGRVCADAQTIYYVTPDGSQGTTEWTNTTTLTDALSRATAGDQIWVQGFETIDGEDKLYTLTSQEASFTVKSGVALYGGFKGDETDIDQRVTGAKRSEMRYRTVLSGDVSRNDQLDATLLIFPGNTTRDDNARHVVVMDLTPTEASGNNNTLPTIIDGLSIAEGHAAGDASTDDGHGGGLLVTGDNSAGGAFAVTNCFFVNNYATQGGAVYVSPSVVLRPTVSTISYSTFFNNAAGSRSLSNNSGGALYVAGFARVVDCEIFNNENGGVALAPGSAVINSTVARNTGSGIEKLTGDGEASVYNTVIWGNSYLYLATAPTFYNSSYHEVVLADGETVDANGNRYVSDKNRGNDQPVPMFESPSLRTSFDRDFNWQTMAYPVWSWDIQEGSAFIDGGDDTYYTADYEATDMAGRARRSGTIDVGAYEYQNVPASRIRYVRTDGNDAADGTSWATAYRTVQHAIDALAATPGVRGEVWVAAGTYEPTAYIEGNPLYPASFRMVDGISVYGGFAGTETSRDERQLKDGGMPWEYANVTILQGQNYDSEIEWNVTDNKWTVNSASTHVVWFAPLLSEGKDEFDMVTLLDGVTIRGGQATSSQASYYYGDRGAGVYMCVNAYLNNAVVTANVASGNGGAVYLNGGRVMSSLIYNNSSDARGGGVYVDRAGIIVRSMLANNSAYEGGGVYLDCSGAWDDGVTHPEYLILSTSVVTNNTSTANGAVYCNNGGVVLQSTIAGNNTPRATDLTDDNASQTGGLYINGYGLVINSVLWNNKINGANVQTYVKNPSVDRVRFIDVAVSSMNNVVWNNTLAQGVLALADINTTTDGSLSPGFSHSGQLASDAVIEAAVGVQPTWTAIDYYWQPVTGSNLRAEGALLGTMPTEVLLEPEQDISGKLFAQKPSIGAWEIDATSLNPEEDGNTLRLYVNIDNTDPDNDGSSWDKAYRSLNEAVSYFAGLPADEVADKQLEIYVKEGDLSPIYAFGNLDPKTATLSVKKTNSNLPLRIVGGFDGTAGGTQDPIINRTILDGNKGGSALADGLYHVITVEAGANVVLDGFHIIGGYAAGTATVTSGAGMVISDNATVEVRNSIFENNTAMDCAAIDGRRSGISLTLVNVVIGNNTNTNASSPVFDAPDLNLNHVTVVNNIGAVPSAFSGAANSFAAGNSSGNTLTLAVNETNFQNPTNNPGATLGFETVYGGYSDYTPLTSSQEVADAIINSGAATAGLDTDLAMNGRDLGGKPDLGALEALLPESGRVYYVRTPANGGNDNNSGLSWDDAFATIRKAVDAASLTEIIDGEKAQVWVAAGTYEQDPLYDSSYPNNYRPNCFEIADGVNVYGAFPNTGNPSMDERRPFMSRDVNYNSDGSLISDADIAAYETILRPASSTRNVRRVLGQGDECNPFANSNSYTYVGEGLGDYKYYNNEYVPKEGGEYYYSENGGEYVRAASDIATYGGPGYYVYYTNRSQGIQVGSIFNRTYYMHVGTGYGDYSISTGWTGNTATQQAGGGYVRWDDYGAGYYQCTSDVEGAQYQSGYINCVYGEREYFYARQGYNLVGEGYGNYTLLNGYVEVGAGNGDYVRRNSYVYSTRWDGFTIRDGYINSNYIRYVGNNSLSGDVSGGIRNGGAGVAFFDNVTIANCVIVDNVNERGTGSMEIRGGGVYCDGGTLVNCYVLDNTLSRRGASEYTGYGGGVYMYDGTAYNCVIAGNVANANHADGAGIFLESAIFFNNTIVGNISNAATRGNGGICVWKESGNHLTAYNCISVGNQGIIGNSNANADVGTTGGTIENYYCIFGYLINNSTQVVNNNCITGSTSIFVNYNGGNYRLNGNGAGSTAINRGINSPTINGVLYELMDYTDMDYTARIKDCTIDAGAYEFDQTEATPDQNGIYYVTQNGAGNASGSSPDNAACATKLQVVLNAAGRRVQGGMNATVRIASNGGGEMVYTANTLSDPNDPQSYTFVIPYGVTLEGGWNEDFDVRNVHEQRTILSPVATVNGNVVNGYHAVTFGEPADGQTGRTTVIDGVGLTDGMAESASGPTSPNSVGGGATVPAWAHVRNCVIYGNTATRGGGLYVQPGGLVTGTLVFNNSADEGAGIYASRLDADYTEVTSATRSHLVSVTVTDNDASSTGGGIYLEDGATMVVNAIVWGNTAPSDKNVSGALNTPIADDLLTAASGGTIQEFYPFNNSFVETYEMPGNFSNTSLESGAEAESKYFASVGTGRTLKEFSPMIKHGSATSFVQYMIDNCDMAASDMQGIARIQDGMDRVDAGAYAFNGGATEIPDNINEVVTRLFVSQAQSVALQDGYQETAYRGKSFLTPFTWLDDALLYVSEVRDKFGNQTTDDGRTLGETEFEILVAGGSYKPHYRRVQSAQGTVDQRQNSFTVPQGVKIYGGFSGTETYSSQGVTTIPASSGDVTVDAAATSIEQIASTRQLNDLNANGVQEPWELANQTILSGQMNTVTDEYNVYHVVYTNADEGGADNPVLLDGLTINYGKTSAELTAVEDNEQVGRGAGVYTSGVDYVVKGCRILNCQAVRGGALYARDADVLLIGSILSANGTVDGAAPGDLDIRGGAVYVTGVDAPASLRAVNTVFANNETDGRGGAIATSDLGGVTSQAVTLDLINCMFVRNDASQDFPAIYAPQSTSTMTNSVVWGNTAGVTPFSPTMTVTYSASDDGLTAGEDGNVVLSTDNMAIGGPRFKNPSTEVGVAGNNSAVLWNPAGISPLTDAGNGELDYNNTDMTQATGAYKDWMNSNAPQYTTFYMGDDYARYSGPLVAPGEEELPKVIDMGPYEYQYKSIFSSMDYVYVDVVDHGDASGNSWQNATSDLRGAINGMANPELTRTDGVKTIYVRGGEYALSQLYINNIAYRFVPDANNNYITELVIKGSYDETGEQDFSSPTHLMSDQTSGVTTNTMMYIATNGKKVTLEGISIEGTAQHGVEVNNAAGGATTFRNVAFRNNTGDGAWIEAGNATNLFVNTLFADGGTGLRVNSGSTATVVNGTFANNTTAIDGTASVFNSISWQSGDGLATDATNHNRDFGTTDNADILNGPNFINPEAGNYNIRPSISVLDMGDETLYRSNAGIDAAADVDLAGSSRLVGTGIDLGAYEYDAELRQVIYVRSGVAGGDGTGSDWSNPVADLQTAVDLASVYHNKFPESDGYVFVHNNVTMEDQLRVSMDGVKVYGGMNGESVEGQPADVLGRRGCFIDYQRQSTLGDVDITANSVVDGFFINGNATVSGDGMLSTSVINEGATLTLDGGLLYNSFVNGTVTGVGEAVNVTSPTALPAEVTKHNMNENATANRYVTDAIWCYQLNEDDPLVNGGDLQDITSYINRAGHNKDLSGSIRQRDDVDGGCFETWMLLAPTTATTAEHPTSSHVVYVTPGQQLTLGEGLTDETSPFGAGFLLLQHGAQLFANGNWVGLDNLAVERTLDNERGMWDMAYIPYDVTRTTLDGADFADGGAVTVKTYDGAARAAYGYRYSATDGAWADAQPAGNTGLLLESADGQGHTVRFYGNAYTEAPQTSKAVRLYKYNYNDPWQTPEEESNRFTHAENMSWNMFGSPYLSGMNYEDMEYGRVIYKKDGETFTAVNTMAGASADGSIAPGSAVFTQTATLSDYESLRISSRTADLSNADSRGGNLAISVTSQANGDSDEFVLTAVPSNEASYSFDLANDGVKMMSVDTTAAQIYMVRSGNRYSMLSAVDVEGTVSVGLHLTAAGTHEIGIPDDCMAYDYETVILTDAATGRVVDLLDAPYTFNTAGAGEIDGRFTIQFNRSVADELSPVTVYSDSNGNVIVEGLETGMKVRIYDASGRMVANRIAAGSTEVFDECERGICLVQVIDGSGEPQVFKARVNR